MTYRLGIDAGSKTIKVVILDESGRDVARVYQRHRSDVATTLQQIMHDLTWRLSDFSCTVAITGSAGIGIAEATGLPFIQEVMATTRAVQESNLEADAFIELGGEDAKIVWLSGKPEQRMNATCAGGTGGFIDTIAHMLGVRSKDFSSLSMGASHIYPIASRCAVFAQTDVRPLLNAGARKADIAASALEAVVRQTISGLACGRPIDGRVVFLGGPAEYIPDLVNRFRVALKLNGKTGIKPRDAHLFTVRGAALFSSNPFPAEPVTTTLTELSELFSTMQVADDLTRLAPLFASDEELAAFQARHSTTKVPRVPLSETEGGLFLGIDAGSTAVKIALVDTQGRLVYSNYKRTRGDVLDTTSALLSQMYDALPKTYDKKHRCTIHHATATGYGEDLLRAALSIDSGVVETVAHTQAALMMEPDATFILDIGGQDMKAIWIKDGIIQDALLNEACSSGCGAFIEGTARSLHCTPDQFARIALTSQRPVDLGSRCTVFMTSRVRHAQKVGAKQEDLAAGIAYSVVNNALFRIIGMDNVASMGDRIVVQGGAFMSDAVLRAFEKISNAQVIRPDTAHLMGAIGAALVARARAFASGGAPDGASGGEEGEEGVSTLLTKREIAALNPTRKSRQCPGCTNHCMVTVIEFGEDRRFISGNKCPRAEGFFAQQDKDNALITAVEAASFETSLPPNAVVQKQRALASYRTTRQNIGRGLVSIGLVDTLLVYDQVPFWHELFSRLGFSVIVPDALQARINSRSHSGMETVPSESVCYSAKLSHIALASLVDQNATVAFMPTFQRDMSCPVASGYANAVADSVPALRERRLLACMPALSNAKAHIIMANDADREAIRTALNEALEALQVGNLAPITLDEFDAACTEAYRNFQEFEEHLIENNRAAIRWAHEPGHHGIVLQGRPYHIRAEVLHSIDRLIQDLGFAVICADDLDLETLHVDHAWKPSRRVLTTTEAVIADPALDLVFLESFGCLFDAVSIPYAHKRLREARRPYAMIKIDDLTDTAHVRIRLRTLAESIEQTQLRQAQPTSASGAPAETTAYGQAVEHGERAKIASAPLDDPLLDAARRGSLDAYLGITDDDLSTARAFNRDLCVVAGAVIGRSIRLVADSEPLERLCVPRTCQQCLLEALPDLVAQACGYCPTIEWVDDWPVKTVAAETTADEAASTKAAVPAAGSASKPLIGIVGAAPLVFDPFLNDHLGAFIEEHGFQPAWPDPANLVVDDVRYRAQLDDFAARGVQHVIYVQSFGCLKGHVQSRGNAYDFATRYPAMPITVLDYDREASALNRENRIRLALASIE